MTVLRTGGSLILLLSSQLQASDPALCAKRHLVCSPSASGSRWFRSALHPTVSIGCPVFGVSHSTI
ncbi:hypothetical protein KC19_4G196500 [Ceratodon purpureus]|uniref:Secreted protein n=1 Tax=Ceratodon purpureus TaxID=3225 RepID=A0A8T0ID34_CERPU|nr:hypothetical protein KC19_4G196500 [Ceratodon purpureus]